MRIVGITGGIGCGKSTVSRMFSELGAVVINADAIGHEVLEQEEVREAARERWGDGIFDPETGQIIRSALARIVFGSTDAAKKELVLLQELTHPRISEIIRLRLEWCGEKGMEIVFLDAPLLFESHWDSLVSEVIFVQCPDSLRWERSKKRGWSRENFQNRESAQISVEEKKRRSTLLLDNSGTLEDLRSEVERIWYSFRRRH